MKTEKLLITAQEVAVYAYQIIDNLPEEEKWSFAARLRSRACDLTQDIAEALGSIDPRDVCWHMGMARRDVRGLMNSLKMVQQLGYAEVEPAVHVKLDNILADLNVYIRESKKHIPEWHELMSGKEPKS